MGIKKMSYGGMIGEREEAARNKDECWFSIHLDRNFELQLNPRQSLHYYRFLKFSMIQ